MDLGPAKLRVLFSMLVRFVRVAMAKATQEGCRKFRQGSLFVFSAEAGGTCR